jgi:SAM-dependent methyltransferase
VEAAETGHRYDLIAESFDRHRSDQGLDYLEAALRYAPPQGSALDAGCGTGLPLSARLVAAGYRTTGIDVSRAMLALAARAVPEAEFLLADMRTFRGDRPFDVLIAWDSLFHLPRGAQRSTLANLLRLVAPGGVALLTAGGVEGERRGEMFDQEFAYSSLDDAEYLSILRSAGMTCVLMERDQFPEDHVVFIARRG